MNLLTHFFTLAYLGPETIMPLASLIAAGVGLILMFWRFIVKFFKKAFRAVFRRNESEPMIPVDLAEPGGED